jgi:hypothetical protein
VWETNNALGWNTWGLICIFIAYFHKKKSWRVDETGTEAAFKGLWFPRQICHEHVSEIKNVNEEIHTCLQIVVMLIDCSKVNWSGDLLYHVKASHFHVFLQNCGFIYCIASFLCVYCSFSVLCSVCYVRVKNEFTATNSYYNTGKKSTLHSVHE